MSVLQKLMIGLETWAISVQPESLVDLHREKQFGNPQDRPEVLLRNSLNTPIGIDAPLHRALTADDRIVVVLDEFLPNVPLLLGTLFDHLATAGVQPSAVTILLPPGHTGESWIDDLPDEYSDVTVEVHDPEERTRIAYLATTRSGRRIYLNRTLVEAEAVIVLSGRMFDPTHGYSGAETAIFPTLSDAETLASMVGKFSHDPPSSTEHHKATEAYEVIWLLGSAFIIQVIEGSGDSIQEILTGLPGSSAEGMHTQDAYWRCHVHEQADLVIATISGDPDRIRFQDLAWALSTAARVVDDGGRIVLLSRSSPILGEGAEILQQNDLPQQCQKVLSKRKPDDWPAAALWAIAAKSASLYVAAKWPEKVIEDLFATPLNSAAEVQRLVQQSEKVLIIPDAHKSLVELR